MNETAYPLSWPAGRARTDSANRTSSKFGVTFAVACDDLERELEKLGASKIIMSTNLERKMDGTIRMTAASPSDPGVAVYFNLKGKPMCFSCDRFCRVWENIRAIGKTIEAIRGIERWGSLEMMERAFTGFVAIPEKSGDWWRDVLGFQPAAPVTVDDIDTAYKRLAFAAHPDHGGTNEQFNQLAQARTAARKSLEVA